MRNVMFGLGRFGLAALILVLMLGGCNSGDTGATGPQGPAGPPGPPGTSSATSLVITVNSVNIGEPSTVDFTITNQDGAPYPGVPLSSLEVMIAKLVPGTNGNPDEWQNYNNTVAQPNGIGPGTKPAIQATTDSGGSLVDHGDGTYTYTFGTDIENVTQPIAVSYDASLVHRVAIDIRSSTLPPANNGIYTWIPQTGARMCVNVCCATTPAAPIPAAKTPWILSS